MVDRETWTPARGDLIWVSFDPQVGHEQAGRRPAVVLSPAAYNRRIGLSLVCPVTSRVKGYSFEVPLPPGLPVSGVVLADQLKSIDWRGRRAQLIGRLPNASMTQILDIIETLLPRE